MAYQLNIFPELFLIFPRGFEFNNHIFLLLHSMHTYGQNVFPHFIPCNSFENYFKNTLMERGFMAKPRKFNVINIERMAKMDANKRLT